MRLAYRWGVRLRFLLRPGWLALTALVMLFAVACFAVLAPWQFSRHTERKTTNDAITRSSTAPPVPIESLNAPTEWRTVTATGTYLQDAELVARLRTVLGEAAFEVLTPLRLTDGTVTLIDRGFVRPDQGRVPTYAAPPTDEVTVTARYRPNERDPRDRTPPEGQLYAIDTRAAAKTTGLDLRPGYLALTENSPGVLAPLPLPELETGPFLSYALQWITFGAMTLLAWLYFTWREIKPGGALATPTTRPARQTVARQIAEEEARERATAPDPVGPSRAT